MEIKIVEDEPIDLEAVDDTVKGASYRGSQHVTNDGVLCQNWSSQTPHKHNLTPQKYPDKGLDSNFCRNPDGEDTIWCYTTDPDVRWSFCDPVKSDDIEGLWGDSGNEYRGKQTTTRNGYTC
jgi:hypothetical protein